MTTGYSPLDHSKVIVCETKPRPREDVFRVEANFSEGVLKSITAGVKKEREDGEKGPFPSFLSCYDFTASPEAWREIIPPLARFLSMTINDAPTSAKEIIKLTARPGRTAAVIPTDTGPLVDAIRSAHSNGRPYHKTGRNGLYARRVELPEGFNSVGRDRLERLADRLLDAGRISQDENGALAVPEIHS